jgi:hypothetical protein
VKQTNENVSVVEGNDGRWTGWNGVLTDCSYAWNPSIINLVKGQFIEDFLSERREL